MSRYGLRFWLVPVLLSLAIFAGLVIFGGCASPVMTLAPDASQPTGPAHPAPDHAVIRRARCAERGGVVVRIDGVEHCLVSPSR